MIWLLALQLSLVPQQQHYDNAKDALAKMQFSRADEEVDLALKADPNFVAALILKSRLALFAHRPDIARSCLIKAVAIEPSSESAQFFLGVFYYLQNDFSLGISPWMDDGWDPTVFEWHPHPGAQRTKWTHFGDVCRRQLL